MATSNKKPEPRLSRRRRLGMTLITIVLLFAVGEVGARLVFAYRDKDPADYLVSRHSPHMQVEGRYTSHPFLPFGLRPSSRHTVYWTPPPWPELQPSSETYIWQCNHNSWGFRGREIALEKPDDGLRVVCLGGSTTYDTATDGETWPEKLEAALQARYPERTVEVLNLGMNAASMPFHIVQFALLGVHFKPDLVIVYAGHNDLWAGLGLQGFRPDYSHRLGHWDDRRRTIQRFVPRWVLKSAFVMSVVVAVDRARGVQYDLVKQIWRDAKPAADPLEGVWAFENGLVTIKGIANAHGARVLVVTPHWAFRKQDHYGDLVERIKLTARDNGMALFDAFHRLPAGDASLVIDDVHFSDKGGTLFATLLSDAIAEHGLLSVAEPGS